MPPPPPPAIPRRQPQSVDGTHVLVGIARAAIARMFFIVHSVATVWQTVNITGSESVWCFALISLIIVFEGSYAIVMRAGDERKWFCISVMLYIVATAPPIWLLETKMCEWRNEMDVDGGSRIQIGGSEDELKLQLLEQLLLVVLIIGRWMLPKGDISREQLSQILLAYLAISSDIVEFFDVFKERVVYSNVNVQQIVLSAWTLSLLQFPFVLTVSRARKMRVAITKTYDELMMMHEERGTDCWNILHDLDLWAILLANCLQDIPFLLVRLYLMTQQGLITYTMIFFTCKNGLIIMLQTYRAFVLINDRYMHPRPPDFDVEHHMGIDHHHHDHKRAKSKRRQEPRDERPKKKNGKSPKRHSVSEERQRLVEGGTRRDSRDQRRKSTERRPSSSERYQRHRTRSSGRIEGLSIRERDEDRYNRFIEEEL